jgi:tripartite-type tricarboxylate transporter receptor subunit TctC
MVLLWLRRRCERCRYLSRALVLAFAIALIVADQIASAQTGTIRIVLPVPPGGAGDIVARLLVEQVSRVQGQTMVIESRPGAGTTIGTEAVTRAAPDGSTLLINAPFLLISPHLRKVSYDPLSSLEPVCYLVSSPGVIVVNEASPYRTLADLLGAARTKPGQLTFASAGPGTTHHIGFEMLRRAADVDLIYVPYPGGAPAISALLGGHVTSVLAEYAPLAEHLKAGKLRAIATTAGTRIPALPDLPTVAESYKNYEVDFWWGLFAPAKTPKQTITRLASWFTAAMQVPELKEKLVAQGFFPVGTCGADFAALLRKQFDEYGRIIREANIKPE